jgi:hypothetical protein
MLFPGFIDNRGLEIRMRGIMYYHAYMYVDRDWND